mgnify:FL=1
MEQKRDGTGPGGDPGGTCCCTGTDFQNGDHRFCE